MVSPEAENARWPERDGMITLLMLASMTQRYDLVVSWPNRPAIYQHSYTSKAACEKGRAVVLDDNTHKIAEAHARVGQEIPGMGRVVAVAPPALPTALCIPT